MDPQSEKKPGEVQTKDDIRLLESVQIETATSFAQVRAASSFVGSLLTILVGISVGIAANLLVRRSDLAPEYARIVAVAVALLGGLITFSAAAGGFYRTQRKRQGLLMDALRQSEQDFFQRVRLTVARLESEGETHGH